MVYLGFTMRVATVTEPMIDQDATAQGGGNDPCEEKLVEKLARFLSQRGVIDDLAMHRALRAQRQSGERFDLVLTRLGLIAEADLAGLVADFLGLPLVHPRQLPEVPLLTDRLQLPFLKSNRIIPVADRGDSLLVAVADPFNTEAAAALSYLLGRPVECGVMAAGEIERALSCSTAAAGRRRSKLRPRRPGRRARTTCAAWRTWRARRR